MTPSQIQELRELADALQTQADWLAEYQHHWTACEQDAKFLLQIVANVRKAYPSLRACADEKERAQAGITEEVVDAAARAFNGEMSGPSWLIEADRESLTAALQSAALALQGDAKPVYQADRGFGYEEIDADEYQELSKFNAQHPDYYDLRVLYAFTADLSRAIGDSNER